MDDAPRVGVGHRVADPDEGPQELDQAERIGRPGHAVLVVGARRLAERAAPDEPHRVIRRVPLAQLVDRDDPRMLELRGDAGLGEEPGGDVRAVGLIGAELLQRDLAPELRVVGQPDLAHAPLGVEVGERVPRPAALTLLPAERADQDRARRLVRVRQPGLDRGIKPPRLAQRLQAAAVQRRRERGLGIAAVGRQLGVQRALELDLLVQGQHALIDEPVRDRYRRLARDRGAGLGQPVGVDRPFLKREHAEEQIALGIHDDPTSEERTSPCSRAIGGPANAAPRSGVFRRPADGTMRPG